LAEPRRRAPGGRRRAAPADLDRRARGDHARLRLHDVATPRPDTYRFAADLLDAAGVQLREVRVMRLADMIFYAQAVLEDGSGVDARPSDAINLALVAGAPVLVEEEVLAAAADSEREIGEELAAALASPRDGRVIAEEFRNRAGGG
jgi:bifunctional DNase/RNase